MTGKKKKPPLTVGARITSARKTYRMSQAQLGSMLDVTRAAISQYEKDQITPRARVIDRLAEVFNAAPEWFTHGRGAQPRPADVPMVIPEIDVNLITPQVDLRRVRTGRQWTLPADMFNGSITPDHMVAFVAQQHIAPIHTGDRVVVDTAHHTMEAQPGVYLVYITSDPQRGGARLHRYNGHAKETAVILGRVVAFFRTV